MTGPRLRGGAHALALGLLTAAAAAAQSEPLLYPGPIASQVGVAIAPVVTDINGDGVLDVVAVSGGSSTVSVTYGRGGFEFGEPQVYASGPYNPPDWPYPWDVAVGDLNEDGQPDLAVANGYMPTVGVLLQDAGTFSYAVQYTVGLGYSEPYSVAIGDLNGDAHLDLVVPCSFSNVVSVLLGAGDGTFSLTLNKKVVGSPYAALVADVDGDGNQDVLITSGGKVSVLLGLGDGNLAAPTTYSAGQGPNSIVLVDLDRDGQRDLVVGNADSDSVSVLPGLAGGTFGAATNYFAGNSLGDLGVADLDGDGNLDVVALSHGSNWLLTMFVLKGQGAGVLGPPTGYQLGYSAWFGAATDLDADGEVDLILGGGQLSILPGLGGGQFETATYSKLLKEAGALSVGEMTGDGIPDLVVANPWGWDSVSVLPGSGSGTFGPGTSYGVGMDARSVALGDLDGDGELDVAVANRKSNSVSVLLNQGAGVLGVSTDYHVVPGPRAVTTGDFDGDGRLDLAVAGFWYSDGGISVLLNQGAGVLGPVTQHLAGQYPSALATADLDGDGRLDLAATVLGGVAVLLGQIGGQFGAAVEYPTGASGEGAIAIGDLNGDAILDLALAGHYSETVELLIGRGGGQFGDAKSIPVEGSPVSIAVGDLDDDGSLDIVAANLSSVSVLLGQGAGAFASPADHAIVPAMAVAVADLNADGRLDLALTNGYSNSYPYTVSILLNKGAQVDDAWTDLGSGLAGVSGIPLLVGDGALLGGSSGSLQLSAAAASAPAILLVATTSTPAPFKCGTLVPVPIQSVLASITDGSGGILHNWTSWPSGVTGIQLFFQYAVQDVAAPCGTALSNALKGEVP